MVGVERRFRNRFHLARDLAGTRVTTNNRRRRSPRTVYGLLLRRWTRGRVHACYGERRHWGPLAHRPTRFCASTKLRARRRFSTRPAYRKFTRTGSSTVTRSFASTSVNVSSCFQKNREPPFYDDRSCSRTLRSIGIRYSRFNAYSTVHLVGT